MKYPVLAIFLAVLIVLPGLVMAQDAGPGPDGKCYVNGIEVPCEQLVNEFTEKAGGLLGFGLIIVLIFWLIGIAAFIFWIMMIVHAVKNPIENKVLWLILILVTGIIGAFVYYFAVKRGFKPAMMPPAPPSYPSGSTPT
ncbi:MAG: PLDc N-terminal domain-containing protein [bacterium]|nr:PLDc N-terminal domain-containing protein [bacterium]